MDEGQKKASKEKRELLRVMKKHPNKFIGDWTKILGWTNSKGNFDRTRITRRLKQLEDDGSIIQIGHRYLINN